jgi:hypothetical protein
MRPMPQSARKLNINVFVDRALGEAFRHAADHYNGRLGMCFSAAMLMWLETDPDVQAKYLARVFDAELKTGVAAAVMEAKGRQLKRIVRREQRVAR